MKFKWTKTLAKGLTAAGAAVGTAILGGIIVPVALLKIAIGTFIVAASQNVAKHGKRSKAEAPAPESSAP